MMPSIEEIDTAADIDLFTLELILNEELLT